MALLGSAALAMWWDMDPALRGEFEHWHTHEHFPERLGLPGFLRASRWADLEGGEGFFVLYDLADHATFTSPAYRARLDDPTPWSLRMMPAHRNMVRSQCRVLDSAGALGAATLATLRFSPRPGQGETLRSLLRTRLAEAAGTPGLAGAHLLLTDTPAAAPTTEQRLRGGGDRAADWILLLAGYDEAALRDATARAFGRAALSGLGADPAEDWLLFRLRCLALPGDLHPTT